jgi:hypothetical protein
LLSWRLPLLLHRQFALPLLLLLCPLYQALLLKQLRPHLLPE